MTDATKTAKQPAEPAASKDKNEAQTLKAEAFKAYNSLVDIRKKCEQGKENDEDLKDLGNAIDEGIDSLKTGLLNVFSDTKFEIPTTK